MANPIPLMIISPSICKLFARPIVRIFGSVRKKFKNFTKDLQSTDLTYSTEEYLAYTFINSLFWFLLLAPLFFILSYRVNEKPFVEALTLGLAAGGGMFLVFFILLLRYPKILAGKKAEAVEQNLVYALKDLLLQITSGVSLYSAMINISLADYGQVSKEFHKLAREVKGGKSMIDAMESLALTTKSSYFKKVCWQLVNTIKAGASVQNALRTIIDELLLVQKTKIRDYAQELNLWALLYMLFAVAIPTIGATMLVILSSFAGLAINQGTFIFFVVMSLCIQVVLIGFIKTRRPHVTF